MQQRSETAPSRRYGKRRWLLLLAITLLSLTVGESQNVSPLERLVVTPARIEFSAEVGDRTASTAAPNIWVSAGDSWPGKLIPYTASILANAPWLSIEDSRDRRLTGSGTLTSITPETLDVSADPRGLSPGTYNTTLSFASTLAWNSPQTVQVTLTIKPPPELIVSTDRLSFAFQVGGSTPASQAVRVSSSRNDRRVSFTVAPTTVGNWILVHPAIWTTPQDVWIFVSPQRLEPGTYAGVLNFVAQGPSTSVRTVLVALTVSRDDKPMISSVVNAASFRQGLAAGAWVSIFGRNLATIAAPGRPWAVSEIVGGKLPTSLEGVSVRINAKSAAMSWVGPEQLNVQVPDDDALGTVSVEVTTPAGLARATAQIVPFAPGLFTSVERYICGVNAADGTLVGRPELIQGARPARPGEIVVIYGTGFGATNPPRPAGRTFAEHAPLANPAAVLIDGVGVELFYAGIVGPGLYQFNIKLPAQLADGDHAVVIEVGGTQTQPGVAIPVQR